MTKALIDAEGTYLASYPDDAPPPYEGAIFAPSAPHDARDRWDGSAWIPHIDDAPFIAAGAARRARQFRKRLAADPLGALVSQAKENI